MPCLALPPLRRSIQKVLHAGGLPALSDLESGYESLFLKGPEAVEFLGRKVNQPWALEEAAGGAQQLALNEGGGSGGEGVCGKETRFYSRAAIVCWPRSKRCETRGVTSDPRFVYRCSLLLQPCNSTVHRLCTAFESGGATPAALPLKSKSGPADIQATFFSLFASIHSSMSVCVLSVSVSVSGRSPVGTCFLKRRAGACLENRHAVQAEAEAGVKRLLARVRQQLLALDEAPRRSAGVVRSVTAAIVSLARQVNWALGSRSERVCHACGKSLLTAVPAQRAPCIPLCVLVWRQEMVVSYRQGLRLGGVSFVPEEVSPAVRRSSVRRYRVWRTYESCLLHPRRF